MIAVVDYGVGNLFSLVSSLRSLDVKAMVTADEDVIRSADAIILPGVGAFGDAIEKLYKSGLAKVCIDEATKGKPILGICLGMQLLFESSYEYGEHKGLGLLNGSVVSLAEYCKSDLKIPHMGWNALSFVDESNPLFKYINNGDFVYFVHSYHAIECQDSLIATAEYGIHVTAAVAKGNVFGCQFHPEKSGAVGLNILKAFCELGAKNENLSCY